MLREMEGEKRAAALWYWNNHIMPARAEYFCGVMRKFAEGVEDPIELVREIKERRKGLKGGVSGAGGG